MTLPGAGLPARAGARAARGVAYGAAQRRRRAAADAFASPAVRASALPRTPGWRRHAPIALYGLALAALSIALARPETTVAVPEEQATVVLAIDRSGSMRATDVAPTRLSAMKSAAARFLDRVPRRVKVGAVAFNGRVAVLEAPTADRAPLRAAIRAIEAKGGTASGDGLAAALDLIRRGGADRPPAAVVLISDGKSTRGRDPVEVAREAAELGVPVYTVALGTPDGTVTDAEGVTHEATPDPETHARGRGGLRRALVHGRRRGRPGRGLRAARITGGDRARAARGHGSVRRRRPGARRGRRAAVAALVPAARLRSLRKRLPLLSVVPLDWSSMGRTTRSVFAVALCSGVAMVGASVHGLLGVDAELQRSALAAQQTIEERHTIRVIAPREGGGCGEQHAPPPRSKQRV